jgi:hypothetical protein
MPMPLGGKALNKKENLMLRSKIKVKIKLKLNSLNKGFRKV